MQYSFVIHNHIEYDQLKTGFMTKRNYCKLNEFQLNAMKEV